MVLWEPPWGRALGDSVWRRTPFFSVSLSPSSFLPGLVVPHAHPWETALGLRAFAGKYLGLYLAIPPPPVPALTCHPSGWPSTVAAARALRQSSTLSEHQPLLEGLSPHTSMDKPGCGQDVSQVPVTWMQLVLGPDFEDR